MRTPNEHGVYEVEKREELARIGRSFAAVESCQCEDGLYRYALEVFYSYGGFGGPIFAGGRGYPSYAAAKDAATQELLARFPKPLPTEPQHVRDELTALKAIIADAFMQPTLF